MKLMLQSTYKNCCIPCGLKIIIGKKCDVFAHTGRRGESDAQEGIRRGIEFCIHPEFGIRCSVWADTEFANRPAEGRIVSYQNL